jgi:class 3 adenylate cyclase
MMVIKTLQQRIALVLLFPVALLLIVAGLLGFFYARKSLLDEWKEAAILKLERAAHYIDMRLGRPLSMMDVLDEVPAGQNGRAVMEWHFRQLEKLKGVATINLHWLKDETQMQGDKEGISQLIKTEAPERELTEVAEVSPHRYETQSGGETVALVCDLKDRMGQIIGRLEVILRFDYLMKDILTLGWWQSDMACLVDEDGRYLAHTAPMMKWRTQLGGTEDPLETAVLGAMREKPSGTIVGSGLPPKQVAGFYRIKRAPWTIILYASGKKILSPIRKFGIYYLIVGVLSIAVILLLIRFVVGKMARSIEDMSEAAREVANGRYGKPLPIESRDEIGQLTRSFNTMVEGLREKEFIRDTFGRYVDEEVAKELLRRPEATRLGGEKRDVAILISDIRGFTPLSESITPEETISILNRYFSRMIEVIHKYKGIIVDFFGDGVLLFFDPLEGPLEPMIQSAVRCALEMQGSMGDFNAEMEKAGLPRLQMGAGVNVGEVIVGNIGSESRAKYGIVGSAVNITERIQSMARGGEVVISESAYRYLHKKLIIEKSFAAQLKGLTDTVNLYLVKSVQSDSILSF